LKGEVCVPNIGTRHRGARLAVGVLATLSAILLLAWLLLADANRFYRLTVALPAWLGAVGFLQYREKT